jgi:hypothetical protein
MVAKQFIFNLESRAEIKKEEAIRRNMEYKKGQEGVKNKVTRVEQSRESHTVTEEVLDGRKKDHLSPQ